MANEDPCDEAANLVRIERPYTSNGEPLEAYSEPRPEPGSCSQEFFFRGTMELRHVKTVPQMRVFWVCFWLRRLVLWARGIASCCLFSGLSAGFARISLRLNSAETP